MFLSYFETYLLTTCKCNANIAAKFMQRFKSIIQMAKNNGWIHAGPFANDFIATAKANANTDNAPAKRIILY